MFRSLFTLFNIFGAYLVYSVTFSFKRNWNTVRPLRNRGSEVPTQTALSWMRFMIWPASVMSQLAFVHSSSWPSPYDSILIILTIGEFWCATDYTHRSQTLICGRMFPRTYTSLRETSQIFRRHLEYPQDIQEIRCESDFRRLKTSDMHSLSDEERIGTVGSQFLWRSDIFRNYKIAQKKNYFLYWMHWIFWSWRKNNLFLIKYWEKKLCIAHTFINYSYFLQFVKFLLHAKLWI